MAERGLTQAGLASIVGVAQGSVCGWLNGSIPQRRTAEALCVKLAVSPDWLLYGIGSPQMAGVKTSDKLRLGITNVFVLKAAKAMKFVAPNLRALRGDLSPLEFSRILGLSHAAVYERYESGGIPRPAVLQRIALRIGVDVGELMAPMPEKRIGEVRSEMKRVAAESVIPSGRKLHPMTRMALMQARNEFATPANLKRLSEVFDLPHVCDEELQKLLNHLGSTAFSSPLVVGRYYVALLAAASDEAARRSKQGQ